MENSIVQGPCSIKKEAGDPIEECIQDFVTDDCNSKFNKEIKKIKTEPIWDDQESLPDNVYTFAGPSEKADLKKVKTEPVELDLKPLLASGKSEGKMHKCKICLLEFTRYGMLRNHMRIHTGPQTYACRLCPFKCYHRWTLKEHGKLHSMENCFLCRICCCKFEGLQELESHMLQHSDEKPLKSNISLCRFSKESSLVAHRHQKQLLKSSFKCEVCSVKFTYSWSLKKHMLTHEATT